MIRTSANTFFETRFIETGYRRCRPFFLFALFLLILLDGSACGKIGPLSLSERPEPGPITDIRLEQRQNTVLIRWAFPKVMKDKKTPFRSELIQSVEIWHSDKALTAKPFRKQAKRMKKFSSEELKPDKDGAYTIALPFELENLDSVTHHFAMKYRYQKQDSSMSKTLTHEAVLPARAIGDLSLLEEGRHIILKWSRPTVSIGDKPLSELIGYRIYRQKLEAGVWGEEKPIGNDPVLGEGYEEEKNETEGEYRYRVTALSGLRIESDYSNPVGIKLVDTLPPHAPANLVCLKYDKHLILYWEAPEDEDVDFYRIFRKQSHVEPFKLLADNVKTRNFSDYRVRRGQSYYYLVTAVDRKGNESRQSNLAEGKLEN